MLSLRSKHRADGFWLYPAVAVLTAAVLASAFRSSVTLHHGLEILNPR